MIDQQFQKACQIINGMHNSEGQKLNEKFSGTELIYSNRMVERLLWYKPDASKYLILAAMCHHLKRWEIGRSEFTMDKQGYFMWRRQVAKHQLSLAESALMAAGLDDKKIAEVTNCLRKENLKKLDDAQAIEDVACMVFVQYYLEDFAQPHATEKVVDILHKTMLKMSPKAISMVGLLELSEPVRIYVSKASELLNV